VPRRPPSWESDEDLAVRVRRSLVRIRDEVGEGEVLAVAHAGLLYLVERELGADGLRLANLDGRWLDILDTPAFADDPGGRIADIARLGDRLSLLAPDQITVPGQI
jgi:hypothetical protein